MYISHFIEKICEMDCLNLLHWFTKLFFIKYKDEYQKFKWTIDFRIFISFIWSRSELWNRNNNNVFTKKRKLAWLDYNDYTFDFLGGTTNIASPRSRATMTMRSGLNNDAIVISSTEGTIHKPRGHMFAHFTPSHFVNYF